MEVEQVKKLHSRSYLSARRFPYASVCQAPEEEHMH